MATFIVRVNPYNLPRSEAPAFYPSSIADFQFILYPYGIHYNILGLIDLPISLATDTLFLPIDTVDYFYFRDDREKDAVEKSRARLKAHEGQTSTNENED